MNCVISASVGETTVYMKKNARVTMDKDQAVVFSSVLDALVWASDNHLAPKWEVHLA